MDKGSGSGFSLDSDLGDPNRPDPDPQHWLQVKKDDLSANSVRILTTMNSTHIYTSFITLRCYHMAFPALVSHNYVMFLIKSAVCVNKIFSFILVL